LVRVAAHKPIFLLDHKNKETSKCTIAKIASSENDTIRILHRCWAESGNGTQDGARDGNPILNRWRVKSGRWWLKNTGNPSVSGWQQSKFRKRPKAANRFFLMALSSLMDRLLFNTLWTIWVVEATVPEERDLAADFGAAYRDYQLVPIHKWPICPISALREKFNPRNINHMPVVKFSARVPYLEQICRLLDGHQLKVPMLVPNGFRPAHFSEKPGKAKQVNSF
jgi:hypothetical protein